MEKEYYRICLRHMGWNDNCFLFWGENSLGYSRAIESIGTYEENETSKDDPVVPKEVVEKYKQKVRLPIYGEKVEKYGGLNEFYVLPNTGQVRKALGITTLDIRLEGNRNSFDAYFKNEIIEQFKQVKSKTHFHVKAKNHVLEFWYLDGEFEAENRNQAILKAFNEWMLYEYDNYIEFKKDVTCSRVKTTVFDKWVNLLNNLTI